MKKREFQKEQTKMRIIEAAIKQFEARGLINTRTSDIADAAMVSHGTIFVHFPTFELLQKTVIEEIGSRISSRLLELAENTIQSTISFYIIRAAEQEINAGKIVRCPPHMIFNTWIGLVHYYLANRDLLAPQGSLIEYCGQELIDHFINLITRDQPQ